MERVVWDELTTSRPDSIPKQSKITTKITKSATMATKECKKCNRCLSVNNFYKHPTTKDKLFVICKRCLCVPKIEKLSYKKELLFKKGFKKCSCCYKIKSISDFGLCKNRNSGLNVYCRACTHTKRQTPRGIFYELKGKAKGRKIFFDIKIEDFIKWYNKQEQKCHYCDISVQNASKFRFNQYYRLTIDRKDNNKGYAIDNICLCCYQCNAVKCDVLTYSEMLKVGKILKERKLNE